MTVKIRHEVTYTFDCAFFARREGEDWVLYLSKVDDDGGPYFYPRIDDGDEPEEYASCPADKADREVGILNKEDWDDLTPLQRIQLLNHLLEQVE